jgi:hypothetical protein
VALIYAREIEGERKNEMTEREKNDKREKEKKTSSQEGGKYLSVPNEYLSIMFRYLFTHAVFKVYFIL